MSFSIQSDCIGGSNRYSSNIVEICPEYRSFITVSDCRAKDRKPAGTIYLILRENNTLVLGNAYYTHKGQLIEYVVNPCGSYHFELEPYLDKYTSLVVYSEDADPYVIPFALKILPKKAVKEEIKLPEDIEIKNKQKYEYKIQQRAEEIIRLQQEETDVQKKVHELNEKKRTWWIKDNKTQEKDQVTAPKPTVHESRPTIEVTKLN